MSTVARHREKIEKSPRVFRIRSWHPGLPGNPDVDRLTNPIHEHSGKWCDDYIETNLPYSKDHNLSIFETKHNPIIIHGVHAVPNGSRWYTGPSRFDETGDVYPFPRVTWESDANRMLPTPDWDYWVTKALVNLNPNVPVVDSIAFAAELRELPGMIKDTMGILRRAYSKLSTLRLKGMTREAIQSTAEGRLLYAFGWKPLVSDLKKLNDWNQQVTNRMTYLQRIAKGDKIQRSLDSTVYIPPNDVNKLVAQVYINASKQLNVRTTLVCQRDIWFTAYVSSDELQAKTLDELWKLSKAATFNVPNWTPTDGVDLPLDTAWELTPWSWLLDYYTNVGDVIKAIKPGIKHKVRNLNLMARTVGMERIVSATNTTDFKFISLPGIHTEHRVKLRHVREFPIPRPVRAPVLTYGQKANLLALIASVKRTRKRIANL